MEVLIRKNECDYTLNIIAGGNLPKPLRGHKAEFLGEDGEPLGVAITFGRVVDSGAYMFTAAAEAVPKTAIYVKITIVDRNHNSHEATREIRNAQECICKG